MKILLLLALLMTACQTIPLEKYANYPILKSDILPTDINNKQVKVLILNESNQLSNHKDLLQKLQKNDTQYSKLIRINLEFLLSSRKYIYLIDRKIFSQLVEENKLAESQNKDVNQKLETPDYIITYNFHTSDVGERETTNTISLGLNVAHILLREESKYSYKEAPNYQASYEWYVNISGNINIYSYPKLVLQETINFKGENSVGKAKYKNLNDSNRQALTSPAITSALQEIKKEIYSVFVPKSYIFAMKRHEQLQYIVQINAGSNDGINKNDHFNFFKNTTINNPINNQEEIEETLLGTGKATSFITSKRAWIYVDDQTAHKLRIGYWGIKKYK